MPIEILDTNIPEVKIIRASRHSDSRGFFAETYKASDYISAGLPEFVQDNLSLSFKGVIRGLHWQKSPHGQGKLVSCLTGSIFDVAVDVRKESPTFGEHVAVILKSSEPISLWVPEGFAHGFQSLEDDTRVTYKVTSEWAQGFEMSINYGDPELGIKWHAIPAMVSEKDQFAPNLGSI